MEQQELPDPAGAIPASRTSSRDEAGPRVVVGVDGSAGARAALLTALAAAARRGAALDVVAAYSVPVPWTGGAPVVVPDTAAARADAQRRAREFVDEVLEDARHEAWPGAYEVPLRVRVMAGPAAQVLVHQAREADLLVVGSRGRGAVRSVLLGSVALHCVTHARCPVLVVHGTPAGLGRPERFVIGVDGSEASGVALRAGLAEAQLRGAEVKVVSAFSLADFWSDMHSVVAPAADQIRAGLQQQTEEIVRAAVEETGAQGVRIDTVVVEGPPPDVLVHRAREATLLVVGSQGRGSFRGLLLGSVALHCAMHSPGPVLVVHPADQRAAVGAEEVRSVPAGG